VWRESAVRWLGRNIDCRSLSGRSISEITFSRFARGGSSAQMSEYEEDDYYNNEDDAKDDGSDESWRDFG